MPSDRVIMLRLELGTLVPSESYRACQTKGANVLTHYIGGFHRMKHSQDDSCPTRFHRVGFWTQVLIGFMAGVAVGACSASANRMNSAHVDSTGSGESPGRSRTPSFRFRVANTQPFSFRPVYRP